MYKKGAGNDKQGKDAGNRTLCPYRNFSQAIHGRNLFNIYINDIYFSFQEDLHNFADDNTVSAIADSLQALLEALTEKANTAIDWFQLNDMIINPGKFKAILRTNEIRLKILLC